MEVEKKAAGGCEACAGQEEINAKKQHAAPSIQCRGQTGGRIFTFLEPQ